MRADELPPYLIALAGFAVAKAIFTWLDMWFAHNVAYGMLAWLRSSAYNALEPLAPAYTLKRRSGDVVSMATADIETIELFFAHTLVPLLDDPGAHGAAHWAGSGRLAVSRSSTLSGAGGKPPTPGPAPGRSGRRRGAGEHGRVNAHLVDSIQGLRELIAFGRGEARAAEVTAGSGRLGRRSSATRASLGPWAGRQRPA